MTAHTSPATAARRGRRPGTNTTRQAVLDAARARFATDGFTATTIRRVAADAGVDASLVMQFFRSKNELFAAVMSIPTDALTRFSTAFEGTDDDLGERVVRAFIDIWEGDARSSEPLMAMLRGAIVNDQANEQLREFLQERLLVDAIASRDVGDATLRAGIVSSMLVGLMVGRGIVGVPTLTGAERETLVALVGPAVQSVLVPQAAGAAAAG
ncbi:MULTISPECIES: TetR/AcrR family transcriptional regulator [unclassified Streptomyces]|uniref:TetR/AcrR family transcriptional regulator n=1 Tax=unclassified Streptomyces TaxID=2593676 RepID=UPI00081F5272|nr:MULTISPECIES: TetR family transcriptional regulator [unclassified Streptomyces]MYR96723.1 TetR family transcriptional regulator [Streptomyces sp. SID4937]SCE15192.1 transcriptional regulator, TetR family [Streptomyces sp. ScaeMP-e83]